MALLGVNIDHIATLREARKVNYPDPALAAQIVQDAGADQITCHLREDRRHIHDQDIPKIQQLIQIPLNLEMAATEEMFNFACQMRPQKITLVPEKREEITTEGGLDVVGQNKILERFCYKLLEKDFFVSLFIDPEEKQLEASRELGVQSVEFHTGSYCNAESSLQESELQKIKQACAWAKKTGFFVAAGHGLNYHNIFPVTEISEIQEYNIGHSIIAHAVIVGLDRAVREMKSLVIN